MKYSILFLCVLAALAGCSDAAKEKSALTRSADQVKYVNEFFGVEVKKPEGWFAQDPETTMKMNAQASGMMAGDNKQMKAIIDQSLKSTTPIFAFFESEPGAPVRTNPSVISVAENVSVMPGVKSGCDYLFHAQKLIEASPMNLKFAGGCQTTQVGAAKLGYLDASTNINGIQVKQRYYACVKGEHALSFIQTYFDEPSKAKVDGVVNSLVAQCN